MDNKINKQLSKTIFWQRVTLLILSLFLIWLVLFLVVIVFPLMLEQRRWESYDFFIIRTVVLSVSSILFLMLWAYLMVNVFKANKSFKNYLKKNDLGLLEIGFRHQRYFWISLIVLIIFFPLMLFMGLVTGVI